MMKNPDCCGEVRVDGSSNVFESGWIILEKNKSSLCAHVYMLLLVHVSHDMKWKNKKLYIKLTQGQRW